MAIALGAVLLSIAPAAAVSGVAYAADEASPPTTVEVDVETPREEAREEANDDDDSNTGLWGLLGLLGLIGLAGLLGRKRNTTDVGYAARPSDSSSTTTTTRTNSGIAERPKP